jgi:hypothetical protein
LQLGQLKVIGWPRYWLIPWLLQAFDEIGIDLRAGVVKHRVRAIVMRPRHAVLILLAVGALIGGSQWRFAKITIKERSGSRTTYRVCWPGQRPDIRATTDKSFTCIIYDWYGLREIYRGSGTGKGEPVRPLLPVSASQPR